MHRNFSAKIFDTVDEAITDIPHNSIISFGGFGLVGVPEKLIEALARKGTKDITAISNDVGLKGYGVDKLLLNGQIK